MKFPVLVLLYILVIALFSNCKGIYMTSGTGEAIEYVTRLGSFNTPDWIFSDKAWYQDSIGISQISRASIEEDEKGHRSTRTEVTGYRFFDLKKKVVYEYASFTDTAPVRRSYRYTDTTLFSGGWNFANRKPIKIDSLYLLADTLIHAIAYKQCRVLFTYNQAKWEGAGLLQCDKKNTYFELNETISNNVGCPLVIFKIYPSLSPESGSYREIKFISNFFPDSVRKVFAAWKRNEILNPVQ